MILSRIIQIFFISLMGIILFTGCSDNNSSTEQTFEEKIWQTYKDNNRLDKYNELIDSYGNIKVILLLNEDEDSWWITNSTLWAVFSVLPDVPDILAGGSVIGLIYLFAWLLGVTLTGGGILAILAWLGGDGVFGIAPSIMGIIYLGAIFAVSSKLFGLLF